MGQNLQRRELDSARLDSWKEIASFFNRDTRTVRRWESDRNLPVHRLPGGERSGVFAYVSELEAWLRTPNSHSAKDVNHPSSPKIVAVPKTPSIDHVQDLPAVNAQESLASSGLASSGVASSGLEEPAGLTPADGAQNAVQPVSALHSLNTYVGTFTAAVESDFAPPPMREAASPEAPEEAAPLAVLGAQGPISRRIRGPILLAFAVSIGVAMVLLHYDQPRPSAHILHKPSPEAQDLYLRGRYDWNLRTEEGLTRSIDLFTQSIVNDPQYAAAYAGLADSYILLRQYGHMPDSEAYPRALAAARQAIALDDLSPDAHRSLAFVLRFWNWDMPAAEKEYRRAIALNPANSQSHHWYATALLTSGRAKEALTEIDIARSLEPQAVSVLADRGIILHAVDPKAGIAALQQLEQSDPAFLSTHFYLSAIYLGEGAYDKFLAESQLAADLRHDFAAQAIFDRAQKLLAAKGSGPMLRQLAGDLAPLADRESVTAYTVARLFSLAGEPSESLHYLRLSFDRRESNILNADHDSTLSGLHALPEYQTLAKKIGEAVAGGEHTAGNLPRAF